MAHLSDEEDVYLVKSLHPEGQPCYEDVILLGEVPEEITTRERRERTVVWNPEKLLDGNVWRANLAKLHRAARRGWNMPCYAMPLFLPPTTGELAPIAPDDRITKRKTVHEMVETMERKSPINVIGMNVETNVSFNKEKGPMIVPSAHQAMDPFLTCVRIVVDGSMFPLTLPLPRLNFVLPLP